MLVTLCFLWMAMTMVLQVRAFSATTKGGVPFSRSWSRRLLSFKMVQNDPAGDTARKRPASSLPPVPPNAHRIVFMRHGESEFNNANIFTGAYKKCFVYSGRELVPSSPKFALLRPLLEMDEYFDHYPPPKFLFLFSFLLGWCDVALTPRGRVEASEAGEVFR